MNATNRTYNGTRHAEFVAINEVLTTLEPSNTPREGKRRKFSPSVLKECILYVTVEPCIMCASLLRQFGIKKVYYGASNEKFGGTGGVLNIHIANGKILGDGNLDQENDEKINRAGVADGDYEVSGGWLRDEAIVMLRRFYVQENERAPEPRTKGTRVLKLEVEPLDEKKVSG